MDPLTKVKKFEIIPVIGAKAITCLMEGLDGNIWGMADGTLFLFNKATRTVVSTHILFSVSAAVKSKHVWINAVLIQHASGRIFGVGYGDLFEINTSTKQKRTISTKASYSLTMDPNSGHLYFQKDLNLWKYIPQ